MTTVSFISQLLLFYEFSRKGDFFSVNVYVNFIANAKSDIMLSRTFYISPNVELSTSPTQRSLRHDYGIIEYCF